MEKKDTLTKIVDAIFSMKKETAYLILTCILGFVLRLISAANLGVYGDDALHALRPINFIGAGKLETYDQSSGLWYAFTGAIYSLFGITTITSRIPSILFGTLSILLIYLLSKEFFDTKIALFSAFLLAISPYLIRNTISEMDTMAMFFVLFSMLVFVRATKHEKTVLYLSSGVLLGLAIYTKVYPIFFIPSTLIYFAYKNKKEEKKVFSKHNTKKILVFLIAAFIFTIPALTHNYLLYKDRGFLDLQFTRTLGLGKNVSAEYYSWDVQFEAKNSWRGLILGDTKHIASGRPLLLGAVDYTRIGDPLAFYLGILGILIILFHKKEYKRYLLFFILSILFILPFLASIILLSKHYIFFAILLIPIAAISLSEISNKLGDQRKHLMKYVIIVLIIFSVLWLILPKAGQPALLGKSHITQIVEFKNKEIPKNALVIADSRIYSGRTKWLLYGTHYVDGVDFIRFLNLGDEAPGKQVPVDIFYFECVKDDCGWGGGKVTEGLNTSMEELTSVFKQNGQLIKEFYEPSNKDNGYKINFEKEKIIDVYKARLNVKDSIFTVANQPKIMHLNSIGYTPIESQFDYYKTHNFFDASLNKLAHWIVLLAVILAFIAPVYVIYLCLNSIPKSPV